MAFQLGDDDVQSMNEMNLIPLIDIMLVLMIIFLVTATVANPSIPLSLPKANATVQAQPPKALNISIKADGSIFLNAQSVSLDALKQRFQNEAKQAIQPTVILDADEESKYDTVVQVMSRANEAGLSDIAFATKDP